MRYYAFYGVGLHLLCTLAYGAKFKVDEKDLRKSLRRFSQQQISKAIDEIDKKEEKFSADASWMYYPEIVKLIKQIKPLAGKKLQGAEIGVLYGGNTEWLLENTSPDLVEKVYGIDPYKKEFFGDAAFAEVLYLKTQKKLQKFGKRCELMRLSSEAALSNFPAQTLDFVFIDGDHSYEAVHKDLKWLEKVRPGGLLIGDDYHTSSAGVIKAVDELCKKHHYTLNRAGNDGRIWWIEKKQQKRKQQPPKQSKKKKTQNRSSCGCGG